jgi:DNA-binding beta-propeller fold protein YncE
MRSRSLLAFALVILTCWGLFAALDTRNAQEQPLQNRAEEAKPSRVLPGIQQDGTVQLPNQWKLRPVGRQLEVGDFPVNIVIHPSGQFMAVLHAGMREHEIVIVDLNRTRQKIVSRVTVDQTFYGMAFSPDGKKIYASGGEEEVVHEFDFDRGLLGNAKTINLGNTVENLIIGGVSIDPTGRDLFACGTWGDTVFRIPVDNPNNKTTIPIIRPDAKQPKKEEAKGAPPSPPDGRKEDKDKGKAKFLAPCHPYLCLAHSDGKKAFVSLWAAASVAIIDLDKNEVSGYISTEIHPTEMTFSPNGKILYVACANSTKVSVIDVDSGKAIQTIHCALYPTANVGNTPNSLCLTPDGEILFVANADNNNLAVFNVSDPKTAKPLGFIPVGWYPTSVRFNKIDKRIYVANGKGTVSKANRSGTNPHLGRDLGTLPEYIGMLFKGCISTIEMPDMERMQIYTKQAYECSPLKDKNSVLNEGVEADNPIPRNLGDKSPIKHAIYIIKENRTYDQVLGDMPQGNGEKALCLFPETITPNHHKIAREFVLLDNIYVDGEVSADGHEWTMGAYATDFVEKYWPLSYRGSLRNKLGYPSEGAMDYVARSSGGYLWDKAAEAGVTYRTYGEWIANGKKNPDGTFEDSKATVKALEGHFDPKFRGYDLDYKDVDRAKRFIEELQMFEKKGEYPQLTILRLPNDHTSGTRVGKPTPTAQVADNDLALGMVVEAVSNSKFWKETAIFVIEDDAQNGPDHVDAHRVVALVISPYTKRGYVDSTMYSTTSMLRTMELILGLKPMSQFDAAARPMYNSFTAKPNLTPYKHEVPKTDLDAKNVAGAWGAEWSERANLEKEDAADDIKFNEVIWKSVKGPLSNMPAPVRAAFFLPKTKKDDDDD